jgi:hypothetical protein
MPVEECGDTPTRNSSVGNGRIQDPDEPPGARRPTEPGFVSSEYYELDETCFVQRDGYYELDAMPLGNEMELKGGDEENGENSATKVPGMTPEDQLYAYLRPYLGHDADSADEQSGHDICDY